MGTFSIWHWAIVLAFFALYVVPVVAADPSKTMARKPYALRTLGFFIAIVVVNAIAGGIGNEAAIIGLILGAPLAVFMVLWSVHRTRDIGWSKWWCLLFLIPFVGLIFWLVLLFKPGRKGVQVVAAMGSAS